ncbi:PhzF family phenazine biosynthesis protein [Angustibacter peucedani]
MQAPDQLSYDVVDVFAERPFAGNPLAVVHGAGELDDGQLQALAREFNLSETAFPVAGSSPDRYALRIFTPVVELPFAGHPSLGAAWSLRQRGLVGRSLHQDCSAASVRLALGEGDDDLVWLTGATPAVGSPLDGEAALTAVGLTSSDLVDPVGRPALVAGTGLPFCYLQVSPDVVARADVDLPALRRARGGRELGGVVVVGWDDGTAHVRVFTDDIGAAAEDPATGSAALGLGVALVATGVLPGEGESRYRVEQGAEIGRPSVLHGRVEAEAGAAVRCHVGGRVVRVASGQVAVPPARSAR